MENHLKMMENHLKMENIVYIFELYIGSFNRDARNLLDHSSMLLKWQSVKFVVNYLVVYGKSPWKVIVLSNVCKS